MEVTQFTYFQEVGSLPCKPVLGEITYGLERLAMYLQGVENVFDLTWTKGVSYGDVYHQNEVEQSKYNFEHCNVNWLFQQFNDYESEAKRLMEAACRCRPTRWFSNARTPSTCWMRAAPSRPPERAGSHRRVRQLVRTVAQSYYESRERFGFPMLKRGVAGEVTCVTTCSSNC